jgi:predicted nucleic acid-binding protein
MIYADSSFILPLYIADRHSSDARHRMAQRPAVILTPFQRAEVTNAIYQHVFRGHISELEARLADTGFESDCGSGVWVLADQPAAAFHRCLRIARHQVASLGARTLDTLHVACALELTADRFWTFDQRQARLAEAAGLKTM